MVTFLLCLLVLIGLANTVLLVGIATLLVRFFDSQKSQEEPEEEKPAPKRRPDPGLQDVTTSQVPYHRQVEVTE